MFTRRSERAESRGDLIMAPVELPHSARIIVTSGSLGSSAVRLRARWGWFAALGLAFILGGAIAFGSLVSATIASVVVNGVVMILVGVAEIGIGVHMRSWGRLVLLCAAGALLMVAGIFCFANPLLAAAVLTLLLGASLCATGLVRIYVASQMGPDTSWRIAILSGLVTFFLGVIILAGWPVNGWYVLGLFLAIDLIFYGVALLGLALQLRAHADL
jgi:uncharacterized membrane protein HdeD (DUF308 family)